MLNTVPSKLCTRARAHGFQRLRTSIYHDEAMFSIGKFGKIVFGLAKTGFLDQGCGVDERKIGHLRT